MTIAVVLGLLQTVIENLPGAVATGSQLYALGEKFFATVKGRPPTQAEKDALRAAIAIDLAEALTPLPPAQLGDPDYVPPA